MTNETISKITQMETKKLVVIGIAVIFVLGLVSYAAALYAPQVSTAVVKVFSKSNETQESNISFKENVTNESDKAPQGPNSVRKSGKDYVLCESGEYCIGMPIKRAVIPSNASSNRTVLSFEQPELPVVRGITPEEARKSFERDKQLYYGEPNYVSFPYGGLENVSGFEINSRNIESKKHLLTNKSRIHGVLGTNGISLYGSTAISFLKSRGVKIHSGYAWSLDVTVPVDVLDDLEKSGHFIWFGLVPKEGKASKKLIENATANPNKVFSVRIWVYDDVGEQESKPFLEPYIAGPVLPKARLSDGVNYYVNMTGSGVMKILEYDFVYGVVEMPYQRPMPGGFYGGGV